MLPLQLRTALSQPVSLYPPCLPLVCNKTPRLTMATMGLLCLILGPAPKCRVLRPWIRLPQHDMHIQLTSVLPPISSMLMKLAHLPSVTQIRVVLPR